MGTWTNEDGLRLEFGPEKTLPHQMGEYRTEGPKRVLEILFDFDSDGTNVPTDADGSVVISDKNMLPIGALVEAVEIHTAVDFDSAGDALVLDVGLIDADGTSNADVDALVDAATQTELNTGGTNVAGWVGVAVGAVALTAAKKITWEVTGADATAGKAVFRIYYSVQA